MPCDAALLEGVELFEHLEEEDRGRLAAVIDDIEVPANATLFHAGEPGDSLFIVRTGEIELYIKELQAGRTPASKTKSIPPGMLIKKKT